jgi:hypothetical protein
MLFFVVIFFLVWFNKFFASFFKLGDIKDNRIGFAVTGATSTSSGISTIFTLTNHNLNSIINLTISYSFFVGV